jgi:hypothetical protein
MTIALVHRPLFVGLVNHQTGRPYWELILPCTNEPEVGWFISTDPALITCPRCKIMGDRAATGKTELD